MKVRRYQLGCLACAAIVIATPLILLKIRRVQDDAKFEAELRAARAVGLPTTIAEFEALLPVVQDSENAGPIYQRMKHVTGQIDPFIVVRELLYDKKPTSVTAARDVLSKGDSYLILAEQATKLPHCRFKRDWNLGLAVLMPEFAEIKYCAKLMLLRGTLAADTSPAAAIEETRKIQVMARHLREEPHAITQLVANSLDWYACRQLAEWGFKTRKIEYLDALEAAVGRIPEPNLKAMHALDLVDILSLVELCATPEGQKKLGLKPEDVDTGLAGKILPLVQSESEGRIRIVRGARNYWQALDLPIAKRAPAADAAVLERTQGLISFPLAFKLYGMFTGDDANLEVNLPRKIEADKLSYRMLIGALKKAPIPKSTPSGNFKSPWDGTPLTYEFDGRQIVIRCSRGNGEFTSLKIPADSAFKKK